MMLRTIREFQVGHGGKGCREILPRKVSLPRAPWDGAVMLPDLRHETQPRKRGLIASTSPSVDAVVERIMRARPAGMAEADR